MEFINYLEEKIQPIEIDAEIETLQYGKIQVTIEQTPTQLIIGHRGGGTVKAETYIENERMISNYTGASANVINEIGTIKILKLTTTEREYTEFKFN